MNEILSVVGTPFSLPARSPESERRSAGHPKSRLESTREFVLHSLHARIDARFELVRIETDLAHLSHRHGLKILR